MSDCRLMPEDFGLSLDPSARVESAGRILLGGTPFRIVTLSDDQAAVLATWRRGEPVGDSEERRRFARALVALNLAQPRPPVATLACDVEIVVPVRDRPRQLRRLLRALAELPDSRYVRDVIVVDDASSDQGLTTRIVEDGGWRVVTEQGWHVRYEPAGRVQHEHRTSPRAWLSRRVYYGRTAAPLPVGITPLPDPSLCRLGPPQAGLPPFFGGP